MKSFSEFYNSLNENLIKTGKKRGELEKLMYQGHKPSHEENQDNIEHHRGMIAHHEEETRNLENELKKHKQKLEHHQKQLKHHLKLSAKISEDLEEASHLYTSKDKPIENPKTSHLYTSNIKIGDKVGGKLHHNSPIAHTHGVVTKIEDDPISGKMIHYKVGEDKYGDVIHRAGIRNIVRESEDSQLTMSNGEAVKTVKHADNHEMVQFLKEPENRKHKFLGLDKFGRPHTTEIN
jgi:hypothetical protein